MIVNPNRILPDLVSGSPAVSDGIAGGSSQGIDFAQMLMQSLQGLKNQNTVEKTEKIVQSPKSKVQSDLTSIASLSNAESEAEKADGAVITQLPSPIILKTVSDGSDSPASPGTVNLPLSAAQESAVIGVFISLQGNDTAKSAKSEIVAASLPPEWITAISGAGQQYPFQLEILNAQGESESFPGLSVFVLKGSQRLVQQEDSGGVELAGPIFLIVKMETVQPSGADSAFASLRESGADQIILKPGESLGTGEISENDIRTAVQQARMNLSYDGEISEARLKEIMANLIAGIHLVQGNPPGESVDSTRISKMTDIPITGQVSEPVAPTAVIPPESAGIRPEAVKIEEGKLSAATFSNREFHPVKTEDRVISTDLHSPSPLLSPLVQESAWDMIPLPPKAISTDGDSGSSPKVVIAREALSFTMTADGPAKESVDLPGLELIDQRKDITRSKENTDTTKKAGPELNSAQMTGKPVSVSFDSVNQLIQDSTPSEVMTNSEAPDQKVFLVRNPGGVPFYLVPADNSSEVGERLLTLLKEIASSGGKINFVFTLEPVKPLPSGEAPSPETPSMTPSVRIKNLASLLHVQTPESPLPGSLTEGSVRTPDPGAPVMTIRSDTENVPVSDSDSISTPVPVSGKTPPVESIPPAVRLIRLAGNTLAPEAPANIHDTHSSSSNTAPAAPIVAENTAASKSLPLLSSRVERIIQPAAFEFGMTDSPAAASGRIDREVPGTQIPDPALATVEPETIGREMQENETSSNGRPVDSRFPLEMKWQEGGKDTTVNRLINRISPESGSYVGSSEVVSLSIPAEVTGLSPANSGEDIKNGKALDILNASKPESPVSGPLLGEESFMPKIVSGERVSYSGIQEETGPGTVISAIPAPDETVTSRPFPRPLTGFETNVEPGTVSVRAAGDDSASVFSGNTSEIPAGNGNTPEAPIQENKNIPKEAGFTGLSVSNAGKSAINPGAEVSNAGFAGAMSQANEPNGKEKPGRSHAPGIDKSSHTPSAAAGSSARSIHGFIAENVTSFPRPLFEPHANANNTNPGNSTGDAGLGNASSQMMATGNQVSEEGLIIAPGISEKQISAYETAKKYSRIFTSHGFLEYREIESGIVNSVVQHARFMLHKNMSSATIQLEPPSLGKLKLSIVTENSKVSGKILVESREVQQIIQNNISDLRQNLAQNGLAVESFDVQVGHNGGTDGWGQRENLESTVASLRPHLKDSSASAKEDLQSENPGRRGPARSRGIIDVWI